MRYLLLVLGITMLTSCVSRVEKQCRERFVPTDAEKLEMLESGIIKDTTGIVYAERNCKDV